VGAPQCHKVSKLQNQPRSAKSLPPLHTWACAGLQETAVTACLCTSVLHVLMTLYTEWNGQVGRGGAAVPQSVKTLWHRQCLGISGKTTLRVAVCQTTGRKWTPGAHFAALAVANDNNYLGIRCLAAIVPFWLIFTSPAVLSDFRNTILSGLLCASHPAENGPQGLILQPKPWQMKYVLGGFVSVCCETWQCC